MLLCNYNVLCNGSKLFSESYSCLLKTVVATHEAKFSPLTVVYFTMAPVFVSQVLNELILYVPVNTFSVISGRVFLG